MPITAANWMAAMLRCVEAGRPWPKHMALAKCAYLCKSEAFDVSPMAFRGLMITSAIYRSWAKLRLKQLAAWTQAWAPDQAFAGVRL
eukprot:11065648-Alexandrium_andersonii.AAC.1